MDFLTCLSIGAPGNPDAEDFEGVPFMLSGGPSQGWGAVVVMLAVNCSHIPIRKDSECPEFFA